MDARAAARLVWFWTVGIVGLCLMFGFVYLLAIVSDAFFGMVMGALMIVAAIAGSIYEIWQRRSRSAPP
jgi:hypothetical protein